MTKPTQGKTTDGKLGPGELRAQTPGAKVPPKPQSAPEPKPTQSTPTNPKATPSAPKPQSAPGAKVPPKPQSAPEPKPTQSAAATEPPKSAAAAVPSRRIHPGTRFLARFVREVIAPDVEWTAKWSATLRGGDPAAMVEQYRANLEALTEGTKTEDDLHKHLKNLHDIRRQLPEQLKIIDELIEELPLEAFAMQRIESKAEAKKRRTQLAELLAELEEREDHARESIFEKLNNTTGAESWREALQHASDEVALLGVDYPILLDTAADLKAELRTIRRHHRNRAKSNAA